MAFELLSRERSGTCLEAKPVLLPLKHIDIASKPRERTGSFATRSFARARAGARARACVRACVGVCVSLLENRHIECVHVQRPGTVSTPTPG